MAGNFNMNDYVDVAARIQEFKAQYPDGTLQSWRDPYVLSTDAGQFVVYSAAAYRTPDDQRPGIGTAWEPLPGKTSFTRESELQNAETAAWGRAIVAVGIPAKHIASREEVQNRRGEDPWGDTPPNRRATSPAQPAGSAPPAEPVGNPPLHEWVENTENLAVFRSLGLVGGWGSTEMGIVLGARPGSKVEASALLYEGGWGNTNAAPGRDWTNFLKRLSEEHAKVASADQKRAADLAGVS